MRALLILTLLALTGCAATQPAAVETPREYVAPLAKLDYEQELTVAPIEAPRAAAFVTSCNEIITAVVVTQDGRALFFDSHSQLSADDLKEWASRSTQAARVKEVGCYKVGEDLGV